MPLMHKLMVMITYKENPKIWVLFEVQNALNSLAKRGLFACKDGDLEIVM